MSVRPSVRPSVRREDLAKTKGIKREKTSQIVCLLSIVIFIVVVVQKQRGKELKSSVVSIRWFRDHHHHHHHHHHHLDNDASELEILGHFETLWDNSEDFLTSVEHFFPSHFRPFSLIIGLLKKTDQRTDGPSYRDAWTHLTNESREID